MRPATPGNLPLIGRTRYSNLYLNTGHGTLGWTQSWGSARALADIVDGRRPAVQFNFLGKRDVAKFASARRAPEMKTSPGN